MAEDVAGLVLRHGLAEMGAKPDIGDGGALTVEAVEREVLHHHDAAAVQQLAADVSKHVGKGTQREIALLDVDHGDAAPAHGRDRHCQFVGIAVGDLVAPGGHVLEFVGGPAGGIDHRPHRRRRLAPGGPEAAEITHVAVSVSCPLSSYSSTCFAFRISSGGAA